MTMYIDTPKVKGWLSSQMVVIEQFLAAYPTLDVAVTPLRKDAAIDGVLIKGGSIAAVFEVKCRDLTLEQLRQHGSYLITEKKIDVGNEIACALRVPFLLLVGLKDCVVWWKLSDGHGHACAVWETRRTMTQTSANGGTTERDNAYLSLDGMQVIDEPETKDALARAITKAAGPA